MKLIDEALQSHYCVISVMGAHANEGSETIFGRKMQDIDKTGTTYWLMRSPKARPPEVQDICKTTTSYVIFIEPASRGGGAPNHDRGRCISVLARQEIVESAASRNWPCHRET